MRKTLKYKTIVVFGIIILSIAISDRNLKLGIVNTLKKSNTIEIIVDGKIHRTLNPEQSILPEEFIEVDLDIGFHKVEIVSKDCDINESFKFLNLIGFNINVEYQPAMEGKCKSVNGYSSFCLTYQ